MTRSAYIPLGGGVDLVTPPRGMSPGKCLYAVNYECPVTGGYRRLDGYRQLGDVVPGQGKVLGVATFVDRTYALRQSTEGSDAVLYRLHGSFWVEVASGLHVGRHEVDEGNLYATEARRSLFMVGGGKPYQLTMEGSGTPSYADLSALLTAMEGELPADASTSVTGSELTVTDTGSRDIAGFEVRGYDNGTLLTAPDEEGGAGDTTLVVDLSVLTVNDIAEILFSVGDADVRLTAPEHLPTFSELTDAPSGGEFIRVHSNHLFLGFKQGVIEHSGIGDPTDWSANGGSLEIGMGEEVTGLLRGRGGVLHVLCRDSINSLYGSSAANFELSTTVPNSGARRYTAQNMIGPYYIAERGIGSLETSSDFGDFRPMQPGAPIEPLFTHDGYSDRAVCSQVSKRLAQYRVFFDDGTGVYLSQGGPTLVRYPDPPVVAHSGEMDSGEEVMLFGTADGRVMIEEKNGKSFDGEPIRAFLTLAYNDLKAPTTRKRFRRVFWDIRSGSGATITIQPDFDFGNIQAGPHGRRDLTFLLGGGLWNVADWDEFRWSVPTLSQSPVDIAGRGTSIGFSIYSEEISEPHEILGYDLVFTPGRTRRG